MSTHRSSPSDDDKDDDDVSLDLHDEESDVYELEQTSVHKAIASSNKGFELMLKMGWKTGTGLGLRGQEQRLSKHRKNLPQNGKY